MLSLLNKRWVFSDPCPDAVQALVRELDISSVLARVMVNRNIVDPQEGELFLDPDLSRIHDPFLMLGMDKAVARVVRAIHNGEKITIYGDYDVDGVTSAALMVHFFRDLGTPFDYYLPDRMEEGYGVNEDALRAIQARGSSLVITADCGITAVSQVAFANSIGLDVIVTDHHQVGDDGLPPALAVLNPHQPGCPYPFKFLSGVGIVFKLAAGIRRGLLNAGWDRDRLPNLKKHLDLFALGTIADMAPLTGENHVLSCHGLEAMRTTTKPGLVALKEIAGVNGRVDAFTIGFGLAPRLNAAGRLGKADRGYHLLMSSDLNESMEMARGLDALNEERKETQQWSMEEAEYLLDRQVDLENDRVIVLASENFHQGVIGIVASKLVEKFYRPTVMIALKDGVGKGSARSIPTFNLFKAFTQCADHLMQYGGHAYAAGLNIEEGRVDDFRKAVNAVGHRFLTPEKLVPELKIDATLPLRDVHPGFHAEIQGLAPFGQVNTVPVFHSRGVTMRDLRLIGRDGSHMRFKAVQNGASIDVVGFKLAEACRHLDPAEPIDMVYQLHVNDWNGRSRLELKLLDLRPSS